MLDSRISGYAVMSPGLRGVGFVSESLEACKRCCFNGDVIVNAIPRKCGVSLHIRYHRDNKWFECSKSGIVFLKCRFSLDWEYCHKFGEVIHTNPYGYSESSRRGIID